MDVPPGRRSSDTQQPQHHVLRSVTIEVLPALFSLALRGLPYRGPKRICASKEIAE